MRLPVCDCGWRGTRTHDREAAEAEAHQHKVWHAVDDSTQASGVPFYVEDPVTLANIAALLRSGGPRAAG